MWWNPFWSRIFIFMNLCTFSKEVSLIFELQYFFTTYSLKHRDINIMSHWYCSINFSIHGQEKWNAIKLGQYPWYNIELDQYRYDNIVVTISLWQYRCDNIVGTHCRRRKATWKNFTPLCSGFHSVELACFESTHLCYLTIVFLISFPFMVNNADNTRFWLIGAKHDRARLT